jgi:hypothetical protein
VTETLASRPSMTRSGFPNIRRPDSTSLRFEPTRSKRPGLVIGSAALVAACAAIFALVYTHSARQVSVIEITRPVMQGQLLTSADVGEVQVGDSGGIAVVPYSDVRRVVGAVAAVSLVSGALLAPGDVSMSWSLPAGDAVVGIDLKPGMLPASGVSPGETVTIVLTGPSGTPVPTQTSTGSGSSDGGGNATSISPSVIGTATVVAVDEPQVDSSDGDFVVSVELSSEVAPAVAVASAAGQAALIEVAPQS